MEAIHRKNLETLREYLRSGELKAEFDMQHFCEHSCQPGSESRRLWNVTTHCGSVGCAVGHATLCVEPKRPTEDWAGYMHRVLGIRDWTAQEEWLFHGGWADVDNTAEGAAARIDWFLNFGVPDDAQGQLLGRAPLCYRS